MTVRRLNHAVLYVRDAEASAAFYAEALGFRTIVAFPGAVFLQASGSTNDHDLGLFSIGADAQASGAGRTTVGLYHLAWEVETLADLRSAEDRLRRMGSLVGATDHGSTKALYAKDIDGIEFEVSWLVPADLLDADGGFKGNLPLDIDKEVARYGLETAGGLGVSWPVA